MRHFGRRRILGLTLVETMVTFAVSAFVFGALGYLTWMSSRNLMNLHVQLTSQQQAAQGLERMCNMFRSAGGFQRHTDDTEVTVTRLRAYLPGEHNGAAQWGMIGYNPDRHQIVFWANENDASFDSDGKAVYDANQDGLDGDTDDPQMMFRNIGDFAIIVHSDYWLTLIASYDYAGFALFPNPEGLQLGVFQTDVRARNYNPYSTPPT